MEINSPILFIEINNTEYIFSVGVENDQENFEQIYKCNVPMQGIENYKITNFDLVFNKIKKNIYIIEQKINFTFKEVVLIINNFECSFINLTGYKKLNGSQILKENITYILNSLKSCIDETEDKKTILHIFNSKYSLNKKVIENLPIGLFGDFYSHELSFCLINNNDYENLNRILDNCNLKIKKSFLKSFVEGTLISNNNLDLSVFYQIKIDKNNSQLLYFENESLKFEQKFDFGSDLVVNDISKVTSLKFETVKQILSKEKFNKNISDEAFVKKDFFENDRYIKIKKKLLFDIAEARIKELSEIIISKNINLFEFNKKNKTIFLKINDKSHFNCLKEMYSFFFTTNNNFKVIYAKEISTTDVIQRANQLAHFGWKREAIPVTRTKKSIIARFFDLLFN